MRQTLRRPDTLVLLAVLLCAAPSLAAQNRQPSLGDRITLAFGDTAGGCIVLADSVARSHPRLTILSPPSGPGANDGQVIRARVGAARPHCSAADSGYAIDGARLESHAPFLAVIGDAGPARVRSDRIEIDLTGDGKPESVRVCTSNEGLHFTIWAGVPFKSRRLAHLYAPLGYDVEPSCKRAEYTELLP